MKKPVLIIAAAILIAAGAFLAIAQKSAGFAGFRHCGPGFGHGPGGPGFGLPLRALGLTDEQKSQVEAILQANRPSLDAIRDQLRANHEKLASLGTDGAFDEAAVSAIAAEQGSLTAKMIVEREKIKAQIFSILTDEQKQKAAEFRKKFDERRKRFAGKDETMPPPPPGEE